ncbi:SDR family oxidoreductase [Parafilimonas sp.]|uniref:SDR family oxidoreductase n=1 Tax=Parafilimonas sp. TaxID=1969739 RepID=UPI0039E2F1A7
MANSDKLVLVTGGSGFVGGHCIVQLLQKGYNVRTTIRSLSKKKTVIEMLKNGNIQSFNNISFAETDLLDDRNWDEAANGCNYALHIASPIHLAIPKDENEMIKPAVNGTLRVLKAARDAGVKRVVMTSNFGAVGYSHKDPAKLITEESWTDPNEKGLSAYNKSKVLAERAAWEFMKNEGANLELTVINPVAIFGPALDAKLSSGFELLKNVLDGTLKRIPNLELAIVDVRDLADLHMKAMESASAKGQRFLALSDGTMSLPEIAVFLKNKMPDIAQKASTKTIPDWAVKFAGLFNPKAKALASMLGVNRKASNDKAKTILGWKPRPKEQAIAASAESLNKFGNIK